MNVLISILLVTAYFGVGILSWAILVKLGASNEKDFLIALFISPIAVLTLIVVLLSRLNGDVSKALYEKIKHPKKKAKEEASVFVKQAIEKQIPTKVTYDDGWRCPTCDKRLTQYQAQAYCIYCGQALEWDAQTTDNEPVEVIKIDNHWVCPVCGNPLVTKCSPDFKHTCYDCGTVLDITPAKKAVVDISDMNDAFFDKAYMHPSIRYSGCKVFRFN